MEKLANVIRFEAFLTQNHFELEDADRVLEYAKELGLSEEEVEMCMVITLQERLKSNMRRKIEDQEERPKPHAAIKKEVEELRRMLEELDD